MAADEMSSGGRDGGVYDGGGSTLFISSIQRAHCKQILKISFKISNSFFSVKY